MRVIYIDTLFLVNFLVDYLLLLCSARLCAVHVSRIRIAAGALLGAFYAAAALLGAWGFLKRGAFKIAVSLLMTLLAFEKQRRFLRIVLVFYAVSAAFGGVAFGLSFFTGRTLEDLVRYPVSAELLLLTFGVTYLLLGVLFRHTARIRSSAEIVEVRAVSGDRQIRFSALVDTGSSLTDPVTGAPVTVAAVDTVRALLPVPLRAKLTEKGVRDPAAFLYALSDEEQRQFRLVPYSTVGADGVLLAFRTERIIACGASRSDALLAAAPNDIAGGGAYSGLLSSAWKRSVEREGDQNAESFLSRTGRTSETARKTRDHFPGSNALYRRKRNAAAAAVQGNGGRTD